MKPYMFAIATFRIIGVLMLLHGFYDFFGSWPWFIKTTAGNSVLNLSSFIRPFISGVALYLAAPPLAKVIIWKIPE
jgi:hypothetical protein